MEAIAMSAITRRRGVLVGGVWLDEGTSDDELQARLGAAYSFHERPRCGCSRQRPELYIARVGSRFILKRMPGSGDGHDPSCQSWSAPEALTGIGRVLDAIRVLEDGTVNVKLDFSLSRRPGRGRPPAPSTKESKVVHADGAKLSLRSLLCWLWDEAEFTSWSPGMAGKRSWRAISWHVRGAAMDKQTRSGSLGDRVWLPEPWDSEHKQQIAARRQDAWRFAREQKGKTTQLIVLIGEVKKLEMGKFGQTLLTLKHLPGVPVVLDEDLQRRMESKFADELELRAADDTVHLVAAATVSIGRTGLPHAQELTLLTMTGEWLPFESLQQREVIETAVSEGRRFVVGQRYDLPAAADVPAIVLTDTAGPSPTPVYIGDPDPAADDDLIETTEAVFRWNGDSPLALPAAASGHGPAVRAFATEAV
ncbi:DUF1173 domain-containing protein [Tsukamurella strandjordii]